MQLKFELILFTERPRGLDLLLALKAKRMRRLSDLPGVLQGLAAQEHRTGGGADAGCRLQRHREGG
jgi:hypothetical protein